MSAAIDQRVSAMAGAAALPRANGELVFEQPWQGRAFGMAVSLHHQGRYDWPAFQQRLIEQIAAHGDDDVTAADYYGHWLAALERLLVDEQLLDPQEIEQRITEYQHGLRDEVF